jgi:hypothetical protein
MSLHEATQVTESLMMPDYPLLINPPRRRLMMTLLRLWLVVLGIVTLSAGVLVYVSIPIAIFYFFRKYLYFSGVWRVYGYSTKLLHLVTFCVSVLCILVAPAMRTAIIFSVSKLMHFI